MSHHQESVATPDRTEPPLAPYAALARELAEADTKAAAEAIAARWCPEPSSAVSASVAEKALKPIESRHIGIWERTLVDGEIWYVRDPRHASSRLWADVERIGPKRTGTRRVVLLGESCARGWPLDPLFTCASALSTYLARAGGEHIEIVDLARLSLEAEPLRHMIEVSRALEPDLYLLFAGNNWVVDIRPEDTRVFADNLRRTGQWRDVARAVDARIRSQVATWMQGLGEAVRESGIPAMYVIPAENIRDRWLPSDLYNPLLSSTDQQQRATLLASVQQYAAAGRWADVEEAASALVTLEEGCSIVGLHWLARAALARNASDEALRLFAEARELTTHTLAFGLNSYITRSDEIRVQSEAQGFHLVDLSRELMHLVDDDLPPGRRSFVDGCHMTGSAIVAAMAAVAERLLPLLDLPALSRETLLQTPIAFEPRAEAQAQFIAAQLNVHDAELAGYQYAQAAACTPEILDVMMHYADLRTRDVPLMLCEAVPRLAESLARFPALQAMGTWPDADRHAFLMDVTTRTMVASRPEALHRCRDLSARRPRTPGGAIDLSVYANQGDFTRFKQERHYIGCLRSVVEFRVLADVLPARSRLSIITRGGAAGAIGKPVSLFANDRLVHTWPVTPQWSRTECVLDLDRPLDGVHVLTIVWPDPEESRDDRLRHVIEALELLGSGDASVFTCVSRLFTVWGELQAFTARPLAEGAHQHGSND